MDPTILEFAQRILIVNLARYFLVASPFFIMFYILFKKKWAVKKIQAKFPKRKDYYREIFYSMITSVIFTGVALVVFFSSFKKYTLKYESIDEYGWGYWGLSVFLMLILHDTYFYWMHRLIHQPTLYKRIHLVHHKSTNPSPWAAYAFHPLEGVLEAAVVFPIVLFIPFHFSALLTFLMIMIIYNVYGHLGFELYPKRFSNHPIGKWLNTSVNHNQHHKHFNGNYGLYFLFWDRWMGTLRTDYDAAYAEVDERRGMN